MNNITIRIIDKLYKDWQHKLILFNFICHIRISLMIILGLFSTLTLAIAAERHTLEAESVNLIGGALKVSDSNASGRYTVSLTKPGDSLRFSNLPAAHKLAIRYASVEVGTISVAVNEQSMRKVNVHSSGNLTGSFLYAIIDIEIRSHANLTISINTNDGAINIDQILIGNGNLGLQPDIWNLPPLPVAAGSLRHDLFR
jgi:hypothetical protein